MKKYLNLKDEIDYNELKEAAEVIKQGGIVIFPTETVYGIGTNGVDSKAIEKLYKIKERPYNKPISLLVSDIHMVNLVAKDITNLEYKLMKKFFPGPLTMILKKRDIVPDILTAGQNTIGVRIPSGKIARKLIEYVGKPIATSSANISGKPSKTNMKNMMKEFKEQVDYFIDSGESEIGIASTVIQVIDGIPNILREGSISIEEIKKVSNCID
ncbi:MAG: L-threonylcarbamoyladenylate synthase [Clostridia bacterium]